MGRDNWPSQYLCLLRYQADAVIFCLISTPVMSFTIVGKLPMIDSISSVILLAPTGPSPVLTIVILSVRARGALTSAATRGRTLSIMSTRAASSYSFHASAFFCHLFCLCLGLHLNGISLRLSFH